MAQINKARFWTGVLYPENMRADWQYDIGDIVQVPFAYCCHTQDRDSQSEHRKDHVHLILAFPNTTTYNHAMKVFSLLSAEGKTALNTVQAIVSIRNMYDYLIHDTDTCRKKGKELYSPHERITGNNFDIGAFEQLGIVERNEMCRELCNVIIEQQFTNFADFYVFVVSHYEDGNYFDILKSHSGLFERLTKANYQRYEYGSAVAGRPKSVAERPKSVAEQPPAIEEQPPECCPLCGSINIKKNGKTLQLQQKWLCKDCGKSFVM